MARLRQAYGATEDSRLRDENVRDRSCSLALCSEFRVTCGADPLLALRSRESFKEIGVFLPQQEIRPLLRLFPAGATLVWSIAVAPRLDPSAQCNGVLPHDPRPLWCLRKTETRHWVQSHLARRVLFSLGGETIYGTARPLSVSLLN